MVLKSLKRVKQTPRVPKMPNTSETQRIPQKNSRVLFFLDTMPWDPGSSWIPEPAGPPDLSQRIHQKNLSFFSVRAPCHEDRVMKTQKRQLGPFRIKLKRALLSCAFCSPIWKVCEANFAKLISGCRRILIGEGEDCDGRHPHSPSVPALSFFYSFQRYDFMRFIMC